MQNKTDLFNLVGWVVLVSLAFYFFYSNALRYFNFSNLVYSAGSRPFAPFIATHVAEGVIALLLGSLQFSSLLRKRYVQTHRNMGKIYLLSILISGKAGAYLAIFHKILLLHDFLWALGVLGMAFAWLVTTGMAFWAIKKLSSTTGVDDKKLCAYLQFYNIPLNLLWSFGH